MAEALADDAGAAVDVVGHSLGGRIALGASLRTPAIRRIVAYEGAPLAPGEEAIDPALEARLRQDLAAGDLDGMLARFMTEAIGMPAADLAAFRADPIWPLRAAAAPTILRELDAAEHAPAAGLDALAAVARPGAPARRVASRRRRSASARRRWTGGWPTAASRSSRAPATGRTTATPPSSSPASRHSLTRIDRDLSGDDHSA